MAALAVAAALMLAIATAVRVTSPGPALYGQVRIGRRGAPFTMWKFRSMVADAEDRRADIAHLDVHGNGHLFKIPADPRVTPLGRWLRRFSLDELPQLLNVVRGEMSLVGPRPPLPREVLTYDSATRRRLSVTPGITGLWQVSGRSDLTAEESIALDLRYVDSWSLRLDLSILLRTARAVLGSDGAY
jgi:lipopolysaccharide/colanic/teichoic acid biosynthesis glycosyltransferase